MLDNWIDELIDYCATQVTDEQLAGAASSFRIILLQLKKAFFTGLFYKYYPQTTAAQTVRKWIPKWQENLDPSGRANSHTCNRY
jgi:asparagine synthase (glutamine-hydrolysing)